jgi:hypothetical protein
VEKYFSKKHPRKLEVIGELLSTRQCNRIDEICLKCEVQSPDLLVYTRDLSSFSFAEVKGPGDRLSEKQIQSHISFARLLARPVEVFTVRISGAVRSNTR